MHRHVFSCSLVHLLKLFPRLLHGPEYLDFFLDSIPSVICRLPLFIISMAHFSMPNSMSISSLYILTDCIGVSNSFSFLANRCHPCTFGGRYFSCDLWSLYQPVHFLSIWFNGIIAIIKSNGDSASSWKIPLWIFTSAKLFPFAVN